MEAPGEDAIINGITECGRRRGGLVKGDCEIHEVLGSSLTPSRVSNDENRCRMWGGVGVRVEEGGYPTMEALHDIL